MLNLRKPSLSFSDLNDSKTARVMQAHEFSITFGQGVSFRRAVIEMTDEAATNQISDKLPWLLKFKGYSGGQLHPDWSKPEKNLTGNHFIRGKAAARAIPG